MGKGKSLKIIPITDTQAAIGAGAIMSFFVAWALIVGVGDDFVCWIGGKENLSGWAQAVGAVVAIFIAIYISHRDRKHSKELQEAAEARLQKRERDTAGALINRFAGTLHAALKSHAEGIDGYLWDVQRTRVLLGAEIELIRNIPISALMPDERFLLFSLQTVALQLFEAMVSAEKSASKNGSDQLVIDQNSHILLDKVAQAHLKAVDERLTKLRDAWKKNGNGQIPV